MWLDGGVFLECNSYSCLMNSVFVSPIFPHPHQLINSFSKTSFIIGVSFLTKTSIFFQFIWFCLSCSRFGGGWWLKYTPIGVSFHINTFFPLISEKVECFNRSLYIVVLCCLISFLFFRISFFFFFFFSCRFFSNILSIFLWSSCLLCCLACHNKSIVCMGNIFCNGLNFYITNIYSLTTIWICVCDVW